MKRLTTEELILWREANKKLGTPIKRKTNITALDYILQGKKDELLELMKRREK